LHQRRDPTPLNVICELLHLVLYYIVTLNGRSQTFSMSAMPRSGRALCRRVCALAVEAIFFLSVLRI
jgi:hypothetical protein